MTVIMKGLFIFAAWIVLEANPGPAAVLAPAAGAFTAIGVFLFRKNGYASAFFCALLCVGFVMRLELEEQAHAFPAKIRGVSPADKSLGIRLRGEVGREAAPGWFVVKVDTASIEARGRKFRGRHQVRSFWGPWSEKQTIEGMKTFLLLAHFGDHQVRSGCRFDARFYGGSLPREAADSSFDRYVKTKGGVGSLRVHSWNVIELRCPEPGWRENLVAAVKKNLMEGARLSGRPLEASMALLLGQAGMLDKEFKTMGRELGILHIFAASGFHLAVFYACFHLPVRHFFGRMHPVSLLLPLPPCFLYLLILDFPVSLSRAFVFVCFAALKSVVHRRTTHADTLLNTAIALLFWMPREVFSLSSVLSFGAAAGILYFYRPIYDALPAVRNRFCRFITAEFALGASAGAVAVPILLLMFHAHSFSSPVINLVLGPLTAFALPLLSLYAMVTFLPGNDLFSQILGAPVRWVMTAFVKSTEAASQMSLYAQYPSAGCWLFLPALFLIVLVLMRIRLSQRASVSSVNGWLRLCLFLLGPGGALFSLAAFTLADFFGMKESALIVFGNAEELRPDFLRPLVPLFAWVNSLSTVLSP